MLKRRDRVERIERAIADTEVAITEQVLRILRAEAAGRSMKTASRSLDALYGILMEYHRARDLIVQAGKLIAEADLNKTASTDEASDG